MHLNNQSKNHKVLELETKQTMLKQIPEFDWWGEENSPPENHKTRKQLKKLGFKPGEPASKIETRKYTLYLYDVNDPTSAKPKKKPTQKQLKALKKGRETQQKHREYLEYMAYHSEIEGEFWRNQKDRVEMVNWARSVLSHPGDVLIFDTETTGLHEPEIVEIALIDLSGRCLLNSRIQPRSKIEPGAIAVHKITLEKLETAPRWEDVAPIFYDLIASKKLMSYNIDFDLIALKTSNQCAKFEAPKIKRWACLMTKYAQWFGEYSEYWGNYKWQPLSGGDHSALGDCLTALACLKEMANDSPEIRGI